MTDIVAPFPKVLTRAQWIELTKMLVRMTHDLYKLSNKDPTHDFIHRGVHMNNIGLTASGKFKFLSDNIVKVPKGSTFTRHKIPSTHFNTYAIKQLLFHLAVKVHKNQLGGGDVDAEINKAMCDTVQVFKDVIENLPIPRRLKDMILNPTPTQFNTTESPPPSAMQIVPTTQVAQLENQYMQMIESAKPQNKHEISHTSNVMNAINAHGSIKNPEEMQNILIANRPNAQLPGLRTERTGLPS